LSSHRDILMDNDGNANLINSNSTDLEDLCTRSEMLLPLRVIVEQDS
jgi:hypothetical protein